jgi:hypothetical protein
VWAAITKRHGRIPPSRVADVDLGKTVAIRMSLPPPTSILLRLPLLTARKARCAVHRPNQQQQLRDRHR